MSNSICQMLHDEHRVTIALMERLEQIVARHRRGAPPDVNDRGVTQLLADLSAAAKGEIDRHFAFEENHLFTYLESVGDAMIGEHLASEHAAMRPLCAFVAELIQTTSGRGFDEETWAQFRNNASELCERMLVHIQKEEMALLPLLGEVMDPETEARLLQEYMEPA